VTGNTLDSIARASPCRRFISAMHEPFAYRPLRDIETILPDYDAEKSEAPADVTI